MEARRRPFAHDAVGCAGRRDEHAGDPVGETLELGLGGLRALHQPDELRERVNLLESHLQRLVGTVERLVDRPLQQTTAAAEEHPNFRTYLDHAVKNDPMPAPPDVDPLFRPRIIKEGEERRHSSPRRPMSRLR